MADGTVDLSQRVIRKAEFGKRLAGLMHEKGWNQSKLAKICDMGRDSVSTYIRGKSVPTPQNLEKLAKKGQFPEVDELKKMVNPPIKKPSNINVKVLNINENNKNNKHDKKKYAILKKIKKLKINEKKFKIWIQIAAFKNMKSAKILKNKFKSLEKININKAFVNGNLFYRVRVGPFRKIEEADKIFNFLIQEGMEGTKIVIN